MAAAVQLGGRESKYTMTVVVKASFTIIPGKDPEPLGKQEPFRGDEFADPEDIRSELRHGCDLAMWKPGADLLLRGTCHAPSGEPVMACEVGWQVGPWSKTLRVTGDRVWRAGFLMDSVGEAVPFLRMPLTWSRAFGGPDTLANPVGRDGAGELLPNIEYPDRMVHRRGQRADPAGFGPINRMWAPRCNKMGTYDQAHFARVHPRFPADFDWSYFSEAPADQQLDHFLRGDEDMVLVNLHPGFPVWRTRLPGRRIRVFVADTDEDGKERAREAVMKLDTVDVDADTGVMALLWRGLLPVRSEDRAEVGKFLVVEERCSEPEHPAAEYLAALPDEPDQFALMWKAGLAQVEAAKAATQGILDRYGLQGMVEQAVADPGLTSEAMKFFPFTTDGPLPASVRPEARAMLAQAQAEHVKAMDAFRRLGAEHGVDIPTAPVGRLAPMEQLAKAVGEFEAQAAKAGVELPANFTELAAKVKKNPADPFGISAHARSMQAVGVAVDQSPAAGLAAEGGVDRFVQNESAVPVKAGAPKPGVPVVVPPPGSLQAALGASADAIGFSTAPAAPETLRDIRQSGQSFAGGNWSGCDFSDLDLTNADFSGAIVSRALFVRSRLQGARFSGTLAQDADFTDACCAGARFEESDLSRVRFCRADLAGATLTSSSLAGASFVDARMVGCHLASAGMEGADLRRADCRDSTMELLIFVDNPMDGLKATGARWSLVLCSNCCLEDAVFDRATLDSVVLSGCRARRIHLITTDARTLRVINGSDLSEAIAVGVQADGSTWMHTLLVHADFEDASLRGACLMDSWCEGARFRRADLSQAMLRRSRFPRADFQAANLFQAGLGLADLRGAILVGSNCYEADFTDAQTTDIDLRLARLTRTSLDGRQ